MNSRKRLPFQCFSSRFAERFSEKSRRFFGFWQRSVFAPIFSFLSSFHFLKIYCFVSMETLCNAVYWLFPTLQRNNAPLVAMRDCCAKPLCSAVYWLFPTLKRAHARLFYLRDNCAKSLCSAGCWPFPRWPLANGRLVATRKSCAKPLCSEVCYTFFISAPTDRSAVSMLS